MKYKLRMEVVVEIPARSSGVRVYSLQISYRELEGPTNALREPRCKLLGPALQGYPVGGSILLVSDGLPTEVGRLGDRNSSQSQVP